MSPLVVVAEKEEAEAALRQVQGSLEECLAVAGEL